MFKIIQEQIAIKLILIVITVVIIASMLLFLYLNITSQNRMYKNLKYSVDNTSSLLFEAYKDPVWNFGFDKVDTISIGVLNTPEFIAINVFNTDELVSGYKKIYQSSDISDYTKEKILEPFIISKKTGNIRKKTIVLNIDDLQVGKFELFYTEKIIIDIGRKASIDMGISLVILASLIIIVILFLMKKLVIIPIANLSDKASLISNNEQYSLTIKTDRKDEIGKLYKAINNMLKQIKKKDQERETILSSLKIKDENYSYMFNKLKNAVDNSDYSRVKIDCSGNSDDNELISSLNIFLETLELSDIETKKQDFLKTGQTRLSGVISGENDLKQLCQNAINEIASYFNAQVGAFYVTDKNSVQNDELKFMAGYAFRKQKGFSGSFKMGEGFVGQVAFEKKKLLLNNLKNNNYSLIIESSIGSSIPKNIFLFPLVYAGEIKGVVELGSFNQFTEIMIEFAQLANDIIAVAINAALE